jgi:HD-GYP domain-containing protein (c-di-GMP phosphodiesterase class II)
VPHEGEDLIPQGRADALADSIVEGGYASLVLDRLVRQTCQVMDVEEASILVRDPTRWERVITVAGCGHSADAVGSRTGADKGLSGRVLASGEAGRSEDRAAVPIGWDDRVRGTLTARLTDPSRRFDKEGLARLSCLADTAGAALQHTEWRAELLSALPSALTNLVEAVDERDPYTAGHSAAVLELTAELGRCMDLKQLDLLELEAAALLHDVGKIGVPGRLLRKPAALDEREQALVRRHAVFGAGLLAAVTGLEAVANIVRFHHERWDGCGYPDGLAGEQIPMASRIVAVCDAYHAMTSDRPYSRALPVELARLELAACAGSQFDPTVVECFIDLQPAMERDGYGLLAA